MQPREIPWGDMLMVADPAPSPEDRVLRAESAYLAVPPRRRGRTWSAVLQGTGLTWDAAVVGYTPQSAIPCPACSDHPTGRCLVCSGDAKDPAQWPMMDPKKRMRILTGPVRRRPRKTRSRRERRATSRSKRAKEVIRS